MNVDAEIRKPQQPYDSDDETPEGISLSQEELDALKEKLDALEFEDLAGL